MARCDRCSQRISTSMDKMVGPDFKQGLANLKAEVEAG